MADKYRSRIKTLQRRRRHALRERKRALSRRRAALLKGNWAEARSARRVAHRKAKTAQDAKKNLRVLRKARAQANAFARLLRHRRSAGKASDGGQLYWWTGRPVRAAVYPHLVWAKKNGWRGVVTSGYRTPFYSQSLCYAMCGKPSCPGRCAGTASNHVRTAIDVSDYGTFGRLMAKCPHEPRLHNRLGARDPVHFSPSGN